MAHTTVNITQDMARGMKKAAAPAFAAGAAVLAASALLPLPAANGRIAGIPDFCLFYRITGLPCPSCGLTRAFVCIGHGELQQSLHWHPIGWVVYGAVVLITLRAGATMLSGRPVLPLSGAATRALGWVSVCVLIVVGLARIAWLLATHRQWG